MQLWNFFTNTGLKLMRKELASDARGALAAIDATHTHTHTHTHLTRQSFKTEREQILQ
jgi:hypothetical protein